ncbi:MAG: preprotein translocase subunit YajC [Pelagibacteraceae bacterium]|jgi:preprotein translocase subunit YajC
MDSKAIGQFIPLILIFVIFYFLLIRPQQKKVREHKAMIDAVGRGDTVVTGGGLIGKVVRVLEDDKAEVEIADNVTIKIIKSSISAVLSKTEPK